MAEKKENTKSIRTKYKARNPKKFAAMYTDIAPYYNSLCKGESVTVDLKNEQVKMWIANKLIIKEN
tara:strand:+ start:361 stop:558 length:198 start_codon:yes stop_codon:yes gene_type:complete